MKRAILTLISLLLVTANLTSGAVPEIPDDWLTRAESSDFRETSSLEETVRFFGRIAARNPAVHLSSFGRSEAGRPLPIVIVARGIAPTPKASHHADRPVLLILCGIHPGEIDGKDAMMMMLRDDLLDPKSTLGASITLVIVPIYNVDGHENVSPLHRPTQNGPAAGTGFRTTARGLDLNRDFMKVDSAEARALIGLYNDWRPDLVVDNHVTNGSDHDWVLTYSHSSAPELAPSLDAWFEATLPAVVNATREAGHPSGPYVSLVDRLDPSKGFDSNVSDPRYSSGYFPLRQSPTILIEMHAHKPFEDRVRANRAFLDALIAAIGKKPEDLTRAVAAARTRIESLGAPSAPPSTIGIRWTTNPEADTILFPVKAWHLEDSVVTGSPRVVFDPDHTKPITVDWFHSRIPELTAPRPRGYIVLPGWPQIIDRLEVHGIVFHELRDSIELEVETFRASNPEFDRSSYQSRVRVNAAIETGLERRTIPKGALWIPADQSDFELVVQLLEPEAPDSLFRWGLLDSALERKVWIGLEDLEAFATTELLKPDVRATWEQALEDEELRDNGNRRYMWWYRRTPHWDETVGLLPIMRLKELPEAFPVPVLREQ